MADRLTGEGRFRRFSLAVTGLALVVGVAGAWVRLTDAGLGCPDWPGCYGRLVVDWEAETGQGSPIDTGKAWREMIHRYLAGMLGVAILALAILAVRNHRRTGGPIAIPMGLVVLVAFQAALGAWTVTLRLQPVVVVAHLMGGMAVFGLLWWLALGRPDGRGRDEPAWLGPVVLGGLVVLVCQIALGGWTSANYAALACPDFPTCHGSWWPQGDYVSGFRPWQESPSGFEGGVLAGPARVAIHVSHRIGAFLTVTYLCGVCAVVAWRGRACPRLVPIAAVVFGLVIVQALLGVSNVWLGLPLAAAVAHNAGAALLLAAVVAMYHRTRGPS